MFRWVGTDCPRPLLAACCLLAVVLLAVVLISKFATTGETQVDASPVSTADQFAETGAGYRMGALGILDLTSARQYTTADSENGYTLSSAKVEVPHYGRPDAARKRIRRSNSDDWPGTRLNTLPNPSPISDDGSYGFTTSAGWILDKRTKHDVLTEARTGHFELGSTNSDAEAPDVANGWSIRDNHRRKHSGSSGGGLFATQSRMHIEGTATSHNDYGVFSRILAFRPSEFTADRAVYKAERTIEIEIVDDPFPEGSESFDFSLQWEPGIATDYQDNFVESEGKRCLSPGEWPITITDTDPPETYMESLEITGSPARNSSYSAGETVKVAATYMHAVNVTTSGGIPTLDLTIGDVTRAAAYASTSANGKTLTFSYTIAEEDYDGDGTSIAAGSIALNEGTIVRRGTSEAANLLHSALGADGGHRVNKDPEIVTGGVAVTSTPVAAADTYGAGETIALYVTFDEPVSVDTRGGTPRLQFRLGPPAGGARDEYLTYVRGSGTKVLAFEYVVQPTDSDNSGIYVLADSLSGNGGTIRHTTTDRDATLSHPHPGRNGDFPGHKVDGGLMPSVALTRGPLGSNSAATGAPSISGTAQVGHVLTASTSGISDADGKTKAESGDAGHAYTYQWVRVDGANETYVSGATQETYTAAAADAGKTLKVTVSFVDDRGNAEGPLTSAATAAMRGSAALSVLDAEAEERTNAVLIFAIRLDRGASTPVTVRYATADGSAIAGSDYTAANSMLTFAPGETQKTVPVLVQQDDALDEANETLTLTLSSASGAYIADGVATGTIITNSEPMPTAWLARFGRTVAGQILDAVDGLFRTAPRQGVEVRIAGERFSGATLHQLAGEEGTPASLLGGLPDWLHGEEDEDGVLRFDSQKTTAADLITGNSIALMKGTRGGGFISLWGQGAITRFDGREGKLSLDAEVSSSMVGAGWTRRGRTAGLVISHSRGEGSYRSPQGSGDVESMLTGIFPYGRYAVSERLSLWGVAGYGTGTQTLAPEGEAPIEADLNLGMVAAGARGELLAAAESGGVELAVKSDALFVRTASEAAPDALSAEGSHVTRLGIGLEGMWRGTQEGNGWPTPTFEIGGRHDSGDAESGFGIDIGAGLSWSNPALGLEAEVRAHGLLGLEDKRFRERGLAGSLTWDPDPLSNRGPSLTLSQTMGATATGGMEALLTRETMAGLADDDVGDLDRRFEARLGYGHSVFGNRFTGTAELRLRLFDTSREYVLGWRLLPVRREQAALELRLEAMRRESIDDERELEHGVRVDLTNHW